MFIRGTYPIFCMLSHSKFTIYIIRKIVTYAITLFVAFSVVFWTFRLIPGDPWSRFVEDLFTRYGVDPRYGRLEVAKFKERFGLDKDIFTQYTLYIQNLFLKFDLGPSFVNYPNPAHVVILRSLPWSIGLLSLSVLISWTIGIIAGTLIGWKRGTKLSNAIFVVALGMSQIPYYILALVFIMVFAYGLGLFPAKWAFSPKVTPDIDPAFIFSLIQHAFLPAFSIVCTSFLGWLISTRALTITILGEDYLLFAQAKGLKKIRVLNRYVLRNILLPQTTGLAISLGGIVNGSYLVEWIFSYPGIGSLLVYTLYSLDYNTAQGIVLLSIFTVLTANLIIDLAYPLIDPRIRGGG